MQNYGLVVFVIFSVSQIGAQFQDCRVPTYCRRTPGGRPEEIWTDLRGRVVLPPTTVRPPTPRTNRPRTTRGPRTTPDPGFSDPFEGRDLTDAQKVRRLTARLEFLGQPGWFLSNNGYQYFVSKPGVAVPYSQARTLCRGMNSRIATVGIRNDTSRNYIVEEILRRCGNVHAFWMGYRDARREGNFVWNDGERLPGASTNWAGGQPDNINNADCAVISRDRNYQWDDVPCEGSKNGILCERFVGTI